MRLPPTAIVCLLLSMLLFVGVEAASQPAIWSGSTLFRASKPSAYLDSFVIITTSTTNKTSSSTVSFGVTYSTIPKMFVAIFKFAAQPTTNLDFDVSSGSLTSTGFTLGSRIGATTTVSLLSIYTMTF